MDKLQAIEASKKLQSQVFSLTPSSLITLFEIDLSDIAFDGGFATQVEYDTRKFLFRFHNNIKLTHTSIFWKGEEYIAAPIAAEGFEISSKGTQPKPKLSISVSEEGINTFSLLKDKIRELGDLTGAKITRIRTFAKYLDTQNFLNETPPTGFESDNKVEFPRDIYFCERKSNENKSFLEWELSSILDLENLALPFRRVLQGKCSWTYRGLGCCWEYLERATKEHDGVTLPQEAPAIATVNDELITDVLQIQKVRDRGKWDSGKAYQKGDQIYIEKGNVKFYFVAKIPHTNVAPPSSLYWLRDECSRSLRGCTLRFGTNLRTSAYPATARYS